MRGEVVVQLVVREPVQREPKKDRTGCKATAHFVDPGVVEGHPAWTVGGLDVRGLDVLPETAIVQVLVGCDGVEVPAAFVAEKEESGCFSEDGAARWRANISVATPEDDERAETEQDRGEQVCEPVANPLLRIYHANLAN